MFEGKEGKTTLYVYVILVISYLLTRSTYSLYGVSPSSAWWTHITYIFCHATLFHLICNMYIFYRLILIPSVVTYRVWYSIVIAIISSLIYLPPQSIMVGFSGAVFALLGLIVSEHYTHRNFVLALLSSLYSLLIPGISGGTHMLCFILGFISFRGINILIQYTYDNR